MHQHRGRVRRTLRHEYGIPDQNLKIYKDGTNLVAPQDLVLRRNYIFDETAVLGASSFSDLAGGSAAFVAAGMTMCVEAPRLELAMRGEFASVGLSQNNCALVTPNVSAPRLWPR